MRLHGFLPNKHDALIQCWFYVGPPSATLAQRKTSIGSMRGVLLGCHLRGVICRPISLYIFYAYTVFLAMKKVGVRQYEDFDSKPGVGVSTQARVPVNGHQRGSQL